MPKKCESCRHYFSDPAMKGVEVCGSEDVIGQIAVGVAEAIDLNFGRMICDKEGDGIFVYFEPIETEPSAGAAVAEDRGFWEPVTKPLVQITRTRSMTAGGAA